MAGGKHFFSLLQLIRPIHIQKPECGHNAQRVSNLPGLHQHFYGHGMRRLAEVLYHRFKGSKAPQSARREFRIERFLS